MGRKKMIYLLCLFINVGYDLVWRLGESVGKDEHGGG